MAYKNRFLLLPLIFLGLLFSINIFGSETLSAIKNGNIETDLNHFKMMENKYIFFGLASYYNNINYYIVDKTNIVKLDTNGTFKLGHFQWLTAVGRLNALVIQKNGLSGKLKNGMLILDNSDIQNQFNQPSKIVLKNKLSSIAPELDQIRYHHLWAPLAWLSKAIEDILVLIQTYIVNSWGFVVVVFAIFSKLLLLPIGIMTTNFQRRVGQVQSSLAPKIAEIKANYDGEEAHNRLMAAHKELGVSPFYTLRPMLGSFIHIPIMIAIFNALGEMPQFAGQSFLWIKDLAYPDAIIQLLFTIPMFGDSINLLPFLMTIITVYSVIVFQNKYASEAEVKRQKRNLYFMAFAFFVLFYSFPAVMVLYWSLVNILQIIQQKICGYYKTLTI